MAPASIDDAVAISAAGRVAANLSPELTRSLTERAYSDLEELIVTLQLAPGSAVSEAELSQRLGIGRTPIREALQRLAREHMVTILPRRGIIVAEINVKSQLRLLEVRREVERLVARSAARRATGAERARFNEIATDRAEQPRVRPPPSASTHRGPIAPIARSCSSNNAMN